MADVGFEPTTQKTHGVKIRSRKACNYPHLRSFRWVSYDKVGVLYSGKLGIRSEARASDLRSYSAHLAEAVIAAATALLTSGFLGAASSTHGLVRRTGVSPNPPYFCTYMRLIRVG